MKATKRNISAVDLERMGKQLKTIAHPVRLEILEILEAAEPLDVSTLCSQIGPSCELSNMSHHLSKMKDNGILVCEKIGKQVYYRILDKSILNIFDCMEKCKIN